MVCLFMKSNQTVFHLSCARTECSTIFEVKPGKSARNIGIDQEGAEKTAFHLGSPITIL